MHLPTYISISEGRVVHKACELQQQMELALNLDYDRY